MKASPHEPRSDDQASGPGAGAALAGLLAAVKVGPRRDVGNYLIVTAVTVLIWYWAAGETRVQEDLQVALRFTVPAPEGWVLDPSGRQATVRAEGSRRALRRAATDAKLITIEVPAEVGPHPIDLTELLRHHPIVEPTGISVVSVNPPTIEVGRDELVTASARVTAVLPGVETIGEIIVEPPAVALRMPSLVRRRLDDELTVRARVEPEELAGLAPGVRHRVQNVDLRRTEGVLAEKHVSPVPDHVSVSFTLTSQIGELTLDQPVRVQLAGAPEDTEYLVEVAPRQLRDVTISAPIDMLEQIRAGQAVVVALLQLKSREKEERIARKRVTCLIAVLPDGSGRLVELKKIGDSTQWPLIDLVVTARPQ